MKKFIIKTFAVAVLLTGITTTNAMAASYNFQATYEHLIYTNSGFYVKGTSSIAGKQNSDEAGDTKAKYSMVSRGSEPADDVIITYFTQEGTGSFKRTFKDFTSYAYLRMDNLNPTGFFGGREPITSSGTYTYTTK
ncbi:hypothetical protein PNH38_18110 [Anoxybacillus rupiensis]|uniref:Uncharacterized protein n=1 Tax=Anoxybacteroides rupiense TaxID=311460 RepID=A0ABT5WA96_9BACL|nr:MULTISPECIES: hypothetical protein [Anoxybacillus]MBB3908796.1 hypothetical protein [Anoxybacillus rupiensis]MBS2772754.1 hypothetical protein [Anoxybacillus rupiensis]MDE8565749.1 hypothetical protein [Anoxybacillus rupiensis]QHC02745.1 hypothetical protein GRQ40_01130 [Anoxybacillus sp. PDR2]